MTAMNHLKPEIFGILEDPRNLYLCEKLVLHFLLEKIHDGVLKTHKQSKSWDLVLLSNVGNIF